MFRTSWCSQVAPKVPLVGVGGVVGAGVAGDSDRVEWFAGEVEVTGAGVFEGGEASFDAVEASS